MPTNTTLFEHYENFLGVRKRDLKLVILSLLNTADMKTLADVYNILEDRRAEKIFEAIFGGTK